MSILPDGGRQREAKALPLSGMARSEAGYSGSFRKWSKGGNVEEGMEVTKRHSSAPSQ